jgi:hypothetical protein
VKTIVSVITRYSDDPTFHGLAGDKSLWDTIRQLLEAERHAAAPADDGDSV